MTAIYPAIRPAIGPAIRSAFEGGFAPSQSLVALRTLIRAGGVTFSAPLVPIGDSHTDNTTGAQYLWNDLKTSYNQPGEGLEGIAAAAIVPMGNNGQTLSGYLAGDASPNPFTAAMALNPSVVLACWLTNDVRNGSLGLTVSAIAAAGAALLRQLITNIRAARPNAIIILRVPAPYLTVNVGGANYIQDGVGNINTAGLAQIYTSGVRAAHYAARAGNPGVLIYDPQLRIWGTTSPTSAGTDFADQIHQNQPGYFAEAKDFASWVDAAAMYSQAATDAALIAQPYTPWLVYNRAVEDATRFVKVAEAKAVAVGAGNTYADFGPSVPSALPAGLAPLDIFAPFAAVKSQAFWFNTAIYAQASNTRASPMTALTATAAVKTRVCVYRQTRSGDGILNGILDVARTSGAFLRIGRLIQGGATFMDIAAASLSATLPSESSSLWLSSLQPGDYIYVEGRGASPVVVSTFVASGAHLRFLGLSGFDWNTLVGRIAIVVRP